MLRILHPQLTGLNCNTCRKYIYDLDTGQPRLTRHSKQPIERRPGSILPCEKSQCPVGHWSKPRSLSPRNAQAYRHYMQCKAMGSWPDDEVVKDNAGIIYKAEQSAERYQTWQHNQNMEALSLSVLRLHGHTGS